MTECGVDRKDLPLTSVAVRIPFVIRRKHMKLLKLALGMVLAWGLAAAEWKAGVARVDITPGGPVWMSGYAARTKPSEGVLQRLGAKALALDDGKGGRAVIVTADVIGFSRPTADAIAAGALKRFGLERAQLVLNASHTHSGPVVRPNLETMYDLQPEQWKVLAEYHAELVEKVTGVIGAALGQLQPAQISYHEGQANFASNRRKILGPGRVANALNEGGPVDRSVPVIQVRDASGKLTAVLFGYACHNTTLTAEFLQLSGDYAGFAQAALEAAHPGATALFFIGTAGDQNPYPRSKLELAEQHGKALAASVDAALALSGQRITGRLRTALQYTDLEFAPRTREDFETELKDKNVFKQRRAQAMLKGFAEGRPVRRVPYPIQGVAFGKGVSLLAMGGEVVVDYNLAAKKLFPKQKLMVAGYSNDVMCYIPSKRVLKEGGYEADDSMIYYGQPGPFADDVEDRVMAGIRKTMARVGVK